MGIIGYSKYRCKFIQHVLKISITAYQLTQFVGGQYKAISGMQTVNNVHTIPQYLLGQVMFMSF